MDSVHEYVDVFCSLWVRGRLKGLYSLLSPAVHFLYPWLLLEGTGRWSRQVFAFRDLRPPGQIAHYQPSSAHCGARSVWWKEKRVYENSGFWEAWLQVLPQIFLSAVCDPTMELQSIQTFTGQDSHTHTWLFEFKFIKTPLKIDFLKPCLV